MSWWFTTHYPHRSPDHPWHVYVKAKYQEKARKIAVGDYVAFYELKDPPRKGRQAVVKFARISGPMRKNFNTDGLKERWEYELPCTAHESGTPVPHNEVCRAIGRKSNGPMRLKTGLKPLKKEQFDALHDAFKT